MSTMLDLAKERDKLKKEYECVLMSFDAMCSDCPNEQRSDLNHRQFEIERRLREIDETLSKIDSGERNKKLKKFAKLEPEEILKQINKETKCSIIELQKLWRDESFSEIVGLKLYYYCYFPQDIKNLSKYFKNCEFGFFIPHEGDCDEDGMICLDIDIRNWEKD